MALTSKRSMKKEDEETVRKLEPHVNKEDTKVASISLSGKSRWELVNYAADHLGMNPTPPTYSNNHIKHLLIKMFPNLFRLED